MLILLCSGVTGPLQAAEFDYGAGYMGQHSDNIKRVSTNEQSDWINSLLAGFAYKERTVDVVAQVHAQATYNDYQKNTFEDETLYNLNSYAVWTISPERFFWTVQDEFQQGAINTTIPYTPANQTNYNVFSTGPDVYFRLAPVHALTFGARVGDVYTGDVNADHTRFTGMAGWQYQSSSTTTLSLKYQILDVVFKDDILNNNFTSQDFFFRTEYRPSRSQFILDLGSTLINFDRGDDVTGPLTRLSWIRQATPQSSFGASVAKEFSNTASDILAATPARAPTAEELTAPSAVSTTLITSDVFETKGGSIFYTYSGNWVGMEFVAGERRLNYLTNFVETAASEDRKEASGHLKFDYFLSATSKATLLADYTKTEYLDFFRHDTDQNFVLSFNHKLTRTVSVGLHGLHSERQTTASTGGYVDNRLLLTLGYSSGSLFMPSLY